MNSAIKSLKMIRVALLTSIVLYVVIGEVMPHAAVRPQNVFFMMFTGVAVVMVIAGFMVRRLMIAPAEKEVATSAQASVFLHRWRGGYIVTFAFSEAIALLGFVLRTLDFTLSQVAPFYIVGFALLVFFGPRYPAVEFPAATS
jgi:hypothetical protein